jgi:hypothetical protein
MPIRVVHAQARKSEDRRADRRAVADARLRSA